MHRLGRGGAFPLGLFWKPVNLFAFTVQDVDDGPLVRWRFARAGRKESLKHSQDERGVFGLDLEQEGLCVTFVIFVIRCVSFGKAA